uniref:Uncharacterized protein n=1 Tax=Kalmanozyma brasiliensis (strain GHG001) TaxID=1365824 RepID=V5EQH2_KALBG
MGGQLVHRYSILSSPILPAAKRDLKVEYVVMNAASYLYFSGEREGPPAPTQQDPHWYLSRMLQERQIHFVNGATDRGTGDDRPEAMAQGADRRERAVNYHRHLKRMEASIGKTGERLWTVDWVPGVKHDGAAMTSSNAAIARIFARIVA